MRLAPIAFRLCLAAAPAVAMAAGPPAMQAPAVPSPIAPPSAIAPPTPLAPPTAGAPAPAGNAAPSPILTEPGPVSLPPPGPGPVYPAAPGPGSIDQQKTQSYRSDLLQQQRELERQGVGPADPRMRDIQQQLNLPGARP